jgi:hypothetical protein
MPDTEGYWITPDGESISIIEHVSYMRVHPEKFGFTKKQVSVWDDLVRIPDMRETILLKAVGKGWIRVRGHRTFITFDVEVLDDDAIWRITEHLKRTKAWDNDAVRIYEHRYNKIYEEQAGAFLSGAISQYARNPKQKSKK